MTETAGKKVIYVGDPMCSWCWGFSNVKRSLEEQCRERAEVSLVVGGLHPGTTDIQDERRKTFLRHHWEDVHERTGQPFTFDLLDRDDFVYDTEPACRAAVAVRSLSGEQAALDFFSVLQNAFYVDNADITRTDVLAGLAEQAGYEPVSYRALLESREMTIATAQDFRMARSLGVDGFPTMVVQDASGYAYLTVGYQPYEQLRGLLDQWLDDRKGARD